MPQLVVLAVAVWLVGCGGEAERKSDPPVSTQQRSVLETIDGLQAASRRGDGQRICSDIFTPGLAKSVAAAAGTSCAREVRQNLFSSDTSLAVGRDIRFDGDRAMATVTEQNGQVSTLYLLKQGGSWRIDRLKPRS